MLPLEFQGCLDGWQGNKFERGTYSFHSTKVLTSSIPMDLVPAFSGPKALTASS